jgi:hypothetical protein
MEKISMKIMYDELRRYGNIIADKNHETTEGHFIRFTTYEFEGSYYVATMFDGEIFMVAEKDDLREMI